jgi:iron complex outermembrane receptor protein
MSARAQQAAPKAQEQGALPEVIISVERVQQSLQSYAGTAVTASQSELDSLGASNLVDLPALMPGVEIGNYEDNTEIYVRGIGSNANTELGDPAVAPHLDDVYVPRPRGLGVAFFDIERVEVNVGPQGTVRGRNALGGTINIVSRKPQLGKFDGYAGYAVGDYAHQEVRGALNLPLGEIAATRFAVYSSKHDPYVKNAGPLTNLAGWESQDDIGSRAHFLLQPSEQFSVLLSGDYLRSRGTGSRGIDFFNASMAGVTVNDFGDPRKVNMVGFSPVQDTRHWGTSLNATYRTDFLNVQYIGGYRDLHYTSDHPTSGRNVAFPGDEAGIVAAGGLVSPNSPLARTYLQERYYGNYSALLWDSTSKSQTHELRFTSPDGTHRLTWAAGLYHFKEDQAVFLGIPLDYSTNLPYLEFNQGSTVGKSKSAYGDLTFAVTNRLKVTAGARYSDESKDRTGFNFIAGLNTNGVAVRTGTTGFQMTGLGRGLRNPDANGDGVPNTLADVVALYRAGIASYGTYDTLNTFLSGGCVQASAFGGTCANYPGLGVAFGGATLQTGSNSASFVDWRTRFAYELDDDKLLYLLVATGNKAPSFNDTVDVDPAHPGTRLVTPPVGPEKSTMYELGSKNTFRLAGKPLILNAAAYFVQYTDQVFSTLVGLPFLANDPAGQALCLSGNPNNPCPTVTLNQNVGKSRNMGLQLDSSYGLGRGFALAGTLLLQHARYEKGSVVIDGRRGSPTGGPVQVDLDGNELARTPPVTLNLRLSEAIGVPSGTFDWVLSATYKSSQFLTAFNGGPGRPGAKRVTAVDAHGVATAYGADLLRLYDRADAYTHLDLGAGYTHDRSNVRVEAFVNNFTNEAHATQAVVDTGTQEFVFNPPRTYGVRVQVNF